MSLALSRYLVLHGELVLEPGFPLDAEPVVDVVVVQTQFVRPVFQLENNFDEGKCLEFS